MDPHRFDALTRSLTPTGSRRAALVGALGGALSTLGLGTTEARRKKKKPCLPCKKRKKGRCKESRPDGTACSGGTCQDGRCCVPETPEVTCRGRCGTWPGNCGQSVSCPACTGGKQCLSNGSCGITCSAAACPPGCDCGLPSVEGPRRCIPDSVPGVCSMQTCQSTADCPTGEHCQEVICDPSKRCVPLCGA
jgi:hypothetical protein